MIFNLDKQIMYVSVSFDMLIKHTIYYAMRLFAYCNFNSKQFNQCIINKKGVKKRIKPDKGFETRIGLIKNSFSDRL